MRYGIFKALLQVKLEKNSTAGVVKRQLQHEAMLNNVNFCLTQLLSATFRISNMCMWQCFNYCFVIVLNLFMVQAQQSVSVCIVCFFIKQTDIIVLGCFWLFEIVLHVTDSAIFAKWSTAFCNSAFFEMLYRTKPHLLVGCIPRKIL